MSGKAPIPGRSRNHTKTPTEVAEKILNARVAANILWPRGGWLNPEWDLTEKTKTSLTGIVRGVRPSITEEELGVFIGSVEWAVTVLHLQRNPGAAISKRIVKLESFAKAATGLANSWAAIGPDAQGSLLAVLGGRVQIAPSASKPSSEAFIEAISLSDRTSTFLREDIWNLIGHINLVVKTLENCTNRSPPDAECVWNLAEAWRNATCQPPTLSRNEQAANGPQATAFQRMLKSIHPPLNIGDWVVREVVEAFGDADRHNPPNQIPKGF